MLAQVATVSLFKLRASVKVFGLEGVIRIQHSSNLFLKGFGLFSLTFYFWKKRIFDTIFHIWFPSFPSLALFDL